MAARCQPSPRRGDGGAVSDSSMVEAVRVELEASRARGDLVTLVETAGGVASPAPSGTLQCDLFQPLGLPGLLVGDGGLGGISSTLCAYEALSRRGIAVSAIALLDGGLENHEAICKHVDAPVITLPPIAPDDTLVDWLDAATTPLDVLLREMD